MAACAILNTPAQDLDPEILALLLSGFARHLAAKLPPEMGMDAKSLFARMAGRLGMPTDAFAPEPPLAARPGPVPAEAQHAAPGEALAVQLEERLAGLDDAVSDSSAADVVTPRAALPDSRAMDRGRVEAEGRRFPPRQRRRAPRSVWRLRRVRSAFHRRHEVPPPRHLTYAACAGPPGATGRSR